MTIPWTHIQRLSLSVDTPVRLRVEWNDGHVVELHYDAHLTPMIWGCAARVGAKVPQLPGNTAGEILEAALSHARKPVRGMDQFLVLQTNVDAALRVEVADIDVPSELYIRRAPNGTVLLEHPQDRWYPKFSPRMESVTEPPPVADDILQECYALLEMGIAQIAIVHWPKPTHTSAPVCVPEPVHMLHAPTFCARPGSMFALRTRRMQAALGRINPEVELGRPRIFPPPTPPSPPGFMAVSDYKDNPDAPPPLVISNEPTPHE